MKKEVIHIPKDPAMRLGIPVSPAVRVGNLLFCSGQVPINLETGEVVKGGIEVQTRQVLENLKTILTTAGSSLDKVVKVTIFLKDINEYGKMNEVYKSYFPEDYPARSCVEVSSLALPHLGIKIEMEAIALA